MTKTKQILQLLALEPSLTVDQIAEKLNADVQRTQQLIYKMRAEGIVSARPSTYSISADGVRRLQQSPKWSPERKLRFAELRRERMHEDREKKAEERTKVKNASAVQQVIRTVPNSVFALGGM